jgi:hypothetical protein
MTQSGPAGVRPDTGRFSYGKLTEMPQSDTALAPKCINLTWHKTSNPHFQQMCEFRIAKPAKRKKRLEMQRFPLLLSLTVVM